jgi:hypothetical protein
VLAFMSQNFAMIPTLSAMTSTLGMLMPYTADRFYLEENFLVPPESGRKRASFLPKNDLVYNAFMVRANVLDRSSLVACIGERTARFSRKLSPPLLSLEGSPFLTS